MAARQLSRKNPDGTQMGQSATDKIGFYGTTAIVQRSGSAQAALTLTTVKTTGFGFQSSAAFEAFIAQLEEIRATLAALGLFKGST